MIPRHDWKALVVDHARSDRRADLPQHTIDELAAHLEDIYARRARGRTQRSRRLPAAEAALAESPLAAVPRVHGHAPGGRGAPDRPAADRPGLTGMGGDLRFAWRQLRRARRLPRSRSPRSASAPAPRPRSSASSTPCCCGRCPSATRSSSSRSGRATPRRRCRRSGCRRSTSWTTAASRSAFTDAAAWWRPEVNLAEPGTEPVRVSTIETSAQSVRAARRVAAARAGFPQDGPFYSRDPIAVISDRLWRQRYNADPADHRQDARRVTTAVYTIAGVMPARFTFPDDVDVWLRLQLGPHASQPRRALHGIGRAPAARRHARAGRARAGALSARLGKENPATNGGWLARPVPLLDDMLGYYRPALFVLLGAVGLVLLTACLNVASLLLARATVRAREIAVRAALGASADGWCARCCVESLLLAAAGTAAGAVAALALLKAAIAVLPASVPRLAETTIDLRCLLFALAVVAATALIFGLLPALVPRAPARPRRSRTAPARPPGRAGAAGAASSSSPRSRSPARCSSRPRCSCAASRA